MPRDIPICLITEERAGENNEGVPTPALGREHTALKQTPAFQDSMNQIKIVNGRSDFMARIRSCLPTEQDRQILLLWC
jgi:hypothetical protein